MISPELKKEQQKREEEKQKHQQDALNHYIAKYGSNAKEMLERAFNYFASFGEPETHLQHVCYSLPYDIPEDEEKFFYDVLSHINFENKERYGFFVMFKKSGFFTTAKISISTFQVDHFKPGFF